MWQKAQCRNLQIDPGLDSFKYKTGDFGTRELVGITTEYYSGGYKPIYT